jgi:spermidine synthase
MPCVKAPPAPPSTGLSPGLRAYLMFTAASTGAVVLIVEILGAKMLSPYVGTSHFVWTAQITITLLALSLGYLLGGKLGDRSHSLRPLYFCILWAAAYLAGTVWWTEPVAYYFLKYNLALGALLSSALLFFVPLTLLAAVVPYLVRTIASSLHRVGSEVGRLSAISTFGSVGGVLLIGYVLIPFLPNSVTMLLSAAWLGLLVLIFFIVWERKKAGPAATLFLAAVCLGLLSLRIAHERRPVSAKVLYSANSNFGELKVLENAAGTGLYYLNDFLLQNTYSAREKKSASLFTYMLHDLAVCYSPEIKKVLCIGLGIGIVPMRFANEGAKVDVVEINPAVLEPGRRFFGLEPEKLNITIGDGRYYVAKCQERYDAIILDAFLGDSSPSHLLTREAFAQMARLLPEQGLLVINCFGDTAEGQDFFLRSVNATLRSAFGTVVAHANGNGNVFFVATPGKELKLHRQPNLEEVLPALQDQVSSTFRRKLDIPTEKTSILTDHFNPIEFFDAANRERNRRTLAFSIREL